MWSITHSRPLGKQLMRQITLFVFAILMVLFVAVAARTEIVFAQTPQATWNGDIIEYDGQSFTKQDPAPSLPGTVCETRGIIYAYFTHQDNDPTKPVTQARVICFKDSEADKSKEIPANVVTFPDATSQSGDGPVTYGSRAVDATSTDIAPSTSGDGSSTSGSDTKTVTTCDSKNTHGLGWLICPITNWMADGMDQLYNILSSFLTVTPLSTTKDSTMYYIWDIMRNLANILFIFGFLIIIYSQITNVGLSSYGIKRLLPRLIIAAVLVNLSYWIVAVAVDLSNILGVVIKDTFDQVINNIPQNSKDTSMDFKDMSWKSVAGVALSGGAAAFGIGSVATAFVASAGGSLWFLLVGLAGVLVSALVAILILAARQALITIFIILSPLAFVAYLLPGTEKYFHRWREFFTTMLIIFPIFAVVFGGARLAGIAIIYSADPKSPNFFNLVVLGMIVQIAPVIITPMLIRFGGSLIGKIAGIVNNPNKGIIDNTRKFAQNRHDRTRNRRLWDRTGNRYTSNDPLAWGGRKIATRNALNEQKLKTWQHGEEAAYVNDHRYHDIHEQHELNEMAKNTGESRSKAEFDEHLATNALLRQLYYGQQQTREQAEAASKNMSTQWEGLKAAPDKMAGASEAERRIGEEARLVDQTTRSLASREAIAKHVQETAYNKIIEDNANTKRREFAGFNEIDDHGVAQVVNRAQEASADSYKRLVEAGQRALQREEATVAELEEIIKNGTSSNPKFAHFANDTESRSAAIRQYVSMASMKQVHKLQEELDLSSNAALGTRDGVIRSEFAAALKSNAAKKPFFVSSTFLAQMTEGSMNPILNGPSGRNKMILDALNKGAFDSELMVTMDQDDIAAIADFLQSPERAGLSADAQRQIINALTKTFDKRDRYEGRIGKRRGNLNRVRNELGLPEIKE